MLTGEDAVGAPVEVGPDGDELSGEDDQDRGGESRYGAGGPSCDYGRERDQRQTDLYAVEGLEDNSADAEPDGDGDTWGAEFEWRFQE